MNKKPLRCCLLQQLYPMASVVFAAEDYYWYSTLWWSPSDPLGNRNIPRIDIQPVTVIAGDELNQQRASTLAKHWMELAPGCA